MEAGQEWSLPRHSIVLIPAGRLYSCWEAVKIPGFNSRLKKEALRLGL
ncbi:MAG TPA: hypothetical protein GX528_06195 [Firmicutes bacterium]|nr:hypothetical protein [Bacillota bacterium]